MAINKVGSKGIEDGAVAAVDFADETVSNDKFANATIENAKLVNTSITAAGGSVSLGGSVTFNNQFVDWQSVVTSDGSTVTTMESGKGYFIDNTSAAGIVKLPASASIGDSVSIKDYAGNFGTNNLTIQRNSHNIQGNAVNSEIKTNRANVVLVYVDSTKGWLYWEESNVADLQLNTRVAATGGTVATSGDFKIHSFTGDGTFCVSAGAGPFAVVDYLVIAGGGGGGYAGPGGIYGGGGAGGYRESHNSCTSGPYTASPLATPTSLPVSVQGYPITVGAGGTNAVGPCGTGSKGSDSIFSTITSAGGGASISSASDNAPLRNGGSGGGGVTPGGGSAQPVASGNTPPVSPPQGNNGGPSAHPSPSHKFYAGAGGGGAGGAGGGLTTSSPCQTSAGVGGAGTTSNITGSPVVRASGGGGSGFPQFAKTSGVAGHIIVPSATPGGGGAGGVSNNASGGSGSVHGTAGTANTGGGGGGNAGPGGANGTGGKGIVIIRYKFQ